MNKKIFIALVIIILFIIFGFVIIRNIVNNKENTNTSKIINEENKVNMIKLKVNDKILDIELEDNSSSKAFIEKLKDGEITINAHDYGNFEKVGELGFNLPNNDTNITTEAGDLILYQGNKITLYYDTNTWNFTKLGKVQDVSKEELKNILGNGNVELTFSLKDNIINDISFDFETKTVTLNDGNTMPIYGLGTYSLTEEKCKIAIKSALDLGYRLIDTAYMYENEKEIGEAIKESGVPREELFITTKIYPNQFADAENAINLALEKLDVDYIDLMLLHHPGTGDIEAYKVMEKYKKEGKIKSIGLSNYYIKELKNFIPQVNIIPALVQNEIHPYYQETEVVKYIQSLGIMVEGWYPLGGRGHQSELLNDEVLKEIANIHNKSVAQVILRWNQQRGIITIPGSSNPDHQKENMEIFDFELSNEEMNKISNLNRDEKHDWY